MPKRSFFITVGSFALIATLAFWHAREFSFIDVFNGNVDHNLVDFSGDVLDRASPVLRLIFSDSNDWRRVSANVVYPNGREFVFLFKGTPQISEDRKRATLNACSVVFIPDESGLSLEERARRALVFESSDRVVLTFSKPVADVSTLQSGRFDYSSFESGEMFGQISLSSKIKSGAQDVDFYLQARDVVFTSKQIRTNFEVALKLGRNSVRGRGLTIDLDAPLRLAGRSRTQADAEDARQTPQTDAEWRDRFEEIVADGNLGRGFAIDQIELNELDGYFRVYLDDATFRRARETDVENAPSLTDANETASQYVDVRCKRGVYFAPDPQVVGGWCVKFNKDVEAVAYENGVKTGRLGCDALYLYLQDPELAALAANRPKIAADALGKTPAGKLAQLEPTILRAQGSVDRRANVKFEAKGSELNADAILYKVRERLLELRSDSPDRVVELTNDEGMKFNANAVVLSLDEKNNLKSLQAGQDGAFETVLKDENGTSRNLRVAWKNGLSVAIDENRPDALKTSTAGSVICSIGDASFSAREAHFWGKIKPQREDGDSLTKQISQMIPLSAAFLGDVRFESARGRADISDSVEIRFGVPSVIATTSSPNAENGGNDANPTETIPSDAPKPFDFGAALFSGDMESDSSAPSKFEIQGQALDLWCVLKNDDRASNETVDVDVYKIELSGDVSLVERAAISGTEKTRLVADFARIVSPGTKNARLELQGGPATFQTQELRLDGGAVAIDCAQNFFRVDGPGKLDVAPPENAASQIAEQDALARFFSNEPAEIFWSKAMTFDGKTLRFEANPGENVRVSQKQQQILCPEARLTLTRPVSLFELGDLSQERRKKGNATADRSLDVELIECLGGTVAVDAIAFGSNNGVEKASNGDEYYRGVFHKLEYWRSTGKFVASGGGSLRATLTNSGKNGRDILSTSLASPFEKALANSSGANVDENDATTSFTAKTPPWTLFHLKFADDATGELARREIRTSGGVRVVVCQMEQPDAPLDVDDPKTFPKNGAYLTADEAVVHLGETIRTSDGKESAPPIEVKARSNVSFRRDDAVGLCDELRYVSDKNVVVLSGAGANKGRFYRQEYSGAEREPLISFTRAFFHLDTNALEIENAGANVE